MSEVDNHENTFKEILTDRDIVGGFIPIPKKLNLILGFNATGILIDLYDRYDYYLSEGKLNIYDEFFYTINDMEINTGLSKKEQSTAIDKLKEYNFILRVISRGMPKKRHFLMNPDIDVILKKICLDADEKKLKITERSKSELERIMGI